MTILVTTEKKPSVAIFRGIEIIFSIGFKTKNNKERASPASKYDSNPPEILIPEIA